MLDWELWSRGATPVTDIVASRPRATVLDLGGFPHTAEPKVAALSVLEQLWAQREERRPILIVIDEAHNICPPVATSAVEQALIDQLVQIAAEGRKFGLWLLLSTQRPTKIHPNVLSQCDNLCLMRMNAPRDLAELADVFGFVPEHMLAESPEFRQGQALFAGGFINAPTFTQMGARITEEGGADVWSRCPPPSADVGARRAQRTSWMRTMLPDGSRNAQSRTPHGCSVGSWTISVPLACTLSKVASRSLVASITPA